MRHPDESGPRWAAQHARLTALRPVRRRWPSTFNTAATLRPLYQAVQDVDLDLVERAVAVITCGQMPPSPHDLRRAAYMAVLTGDGLRAVTVFDDIVAAVSRLAPGDRFEWPEDVPAWARGLWSSSGIATQRHLVHGDRLRTMWIDAVRRLVDQHVQRWNGRRDAVDLDRPVHTSPRSTSSD